ncbi:MAG: hypothetical protein R3B06_24815 [Kofleriaceae bacterium]
MRTAWSISVAVALATPRLAQAQASQPRVAVVVDFVANLAPARATELSAAMADALGRSLEVDAVGGADVTRRLPDGGVPDECLATPGCVAGLGARLDARTLLFLSIVQLGTAVQIDATWVDVATGEAVARPRIELPADARAGEVFTDAAPRLLPEARPRLAPVLDPVVPGPTGPVRTPRTLSTAAWGLGGGGVAAALAGGGLGLAVRGTYQRCEREPDRCSAADRSGLRWKSALADGLVVVGVAGVVTAAVLYLRSGRVVDDAPATAWQLRPTRAGATVELHGRF